MNDQDDIKSILELYNQNKLFEAKEEINKKIAKNSNSHVLYNILGAIFAGQDQLDEAIKNYKKSIEINSDYAQAYNNLGASQHKLNKINEAVGSYKKAISLKTDFAEAYNNLGNAFRDLDKPKEALTHLKKAIEINSDYSEAYNNLGAAYQDLSNNEEALKNFQKAIKIKPNYTEAYNNLGMLFSDLARFDESLNCYKKAIEIKPNYEKAYNNLGNLFNNLGRYDEASAAFNQAIKIKPDYAKAYSNLLFNLNYKTNFNPTTYLSEAKKFRAKCEPVKKNISVSYNYEKKPKKIRLGLVSADFGNHPGGFFTLSTLRELRKKNFELVAYATTSRQDELSSFFRPLFSKWHFVEKKNDEEIVEQIFKDGIHILMDLQGHSAKNRLPIFIYKPAPIQVSWLAQGSTGIPEIDYFIGSDHITPKEEEKHYVEKILRMPEISQCFTPPIFDVKINSLPALKNNFITFGCVNKLSKINDDVIFLWSKILSSVSNSKLLLKNRDLDNKGIVEKIIERFGKHNINSNRLILIGKSKTRRELLKIYNEIDIALDPFPFQGNTSTCEAVWMGIPVLTLKGDRYLSHFGESINSNLDMNNWIAKNQEEYVTLAIKYSSDIDSLSKIRVNLRDVALNSPVFDALRFSEHFSSALWEIWNNFSKNN